MLTTLVWDSLKIEKTFAPEAQKSIGDFIFARYKE
jgi:hypothetical protein